MQSPVSHVASTQDLTPKLQKIVDQLKRMLEYGDFEPIVSVERESTAKPVPKKVFDDMRSCSAGIIHVAKEQTIIDADGHEHHLLNHNVLTEIGGGLVRWRDNFILLVEEGTTPPSNLQGLYEVRYEGTTLDADATMRLLEAFNQFKKQVRYPPGKGRVGDQPFWGCARVAPGASGTLVCPSTPASAAVLVRAHFEQRT